MVRQERVRCLSKGMKDGKYFVFIAFPSGVGHELEVDKVTYDRTLVA